MSRHIGRTRLKLAEMLSERLRTYIDPADLSSAKGSYRTRPGLECLQWEGPMGLGCWDSMTDCVRHGFDLTFGDISSPTVSGCRIHVDAKARGNRG